MNDLFEKAIESRIIQYKIILLILLFFLSGWCHSQNAPIANISNAYGCPGSSVLIPVTVTGFSNITSISLRIEYDPSVITFDTSLFSFNTTLSLVSLPVFNVTPVGGGSGLWKFMISWISIVPQSLIEGSDLMVLGFSYSGGNSELSFNNSSNGGIDCEYTDQYYDPLTDIPSATYYQNGWVSPGTEGGLVSGDTTIIFGQTTGTLILSGYLGTVLKWQKQYNGNGYSDIPSTVNLTTYSEAPVYTGTWKYRAVVQYNTCAVQYSLPATVLVNTPSGVSKTWTGFQDEDWKNPDNWNPAGIPVLTDNIIIPVLVPAMPVVKNNGLAGNNLTIEKGASLTINNGITLTMSGELTIEGE